jgi:hypothetical protein
VSLAPLVAALGSQSPRSDDDEVDERSSEGQEENIKQENDSKSEERVGFRKATIPKPPHRHRRRLGICSQAQLRHASPRGKISRQNTCRPNLSQSGSLQRLTRRTLHLEQHSGSVVATHRSSRISRPRRDEAQVPPRRLRQIERRVVVPRRSSRSSLGGEERKTI